VVVRSAVFTWKDLAQVKALRTLAGVCMLLMTRFGSSLQEDQQLLASELQGSAPLSQDLQQAIRFRMEKKKLVAGVLRLISETIQVCGLFLRIIRALCHMFP
jgi:hypothetical protein